MKLVDLFCGAGGFSLGAHLARHEVAAAYDIDEDLTSSFPRNFCQTQLRLEDVSRLAGHNVIEAAGGQIDGIIGGPPCQGFSEIGRRDSNDPRRDLLRHFFRIVSEVEPSFFVMENVRGLMYADARNVLNQGLALVDAKYQILGPLLLDPSNFGAATRRPRIFVIGTHKDLGPVMSREAILDQTAEPSTVEDAIADLRDATFNGLENGFDVWSLARLRSLSSYAKARRSPTGTVTGHAAVNHSELVRERFGLLKPGTIDPIGRHPRLRWNGQCPTLRAGTGSDKGRFQSVRPVHPSEHRVITVREAARLQGFPDSHLFHPTTWHSFRMIGNSVSPIIASVILAAVSEHLSAASA